jgi:hypothetical protein
LSWAGPWRVLRNEIKGGPHDPHGEEAPLRCLEL